jgi:hypothetical protein
LRPFIDIVEHHHFDLILVGMSLATEVCLTLHFERLEHYHISPSNRFKAVIDEYSRAKNSDQTGLRLLRSLHHQQESSLVGQATLAVERDTNS